MVTAPLSNLGAMRTADEYRAKAIEAEETARQMSRADHRAELMRLARTWRDLAARLDPPPPPQSSGETEAA